MRYAVLAAVTLAVGSCSLGDQSPQATLTVEADSLPFVEIPGSSADGEPVLSRAVAGTRFPDGRLLVVDQLGKDLVLFDSTGKLIARVGRAGEGPGEFQWPLWIGRCAGDSGFVWDSRLSRMTVVTSEGVPTRQFGFFRRPAIVSCFPRGRFALLLSPDQMPMVDPRGHSPPMQSHLIIASATGDSVLDLGLVQIGETRPLGLRTRLAAADRFYLGTGDSAYVDRYDPAGRKTATLSVADPRRPPTRADYEHDIDRQLAAFPAGDREPVRTLMLSIPMPDFLPAYQDLLADPTGAVWVVTSSPADSITVLQGTAPDSRALGSLRFPDWFVPFEIGRDYVLGVTQAPDGEQRVREYRLRRRSL
jgi:hypothetical protein